MAWSMPFVLKKEDVVSKRQFFKVPVPILEVVLKEGLFGPFRFFMYCKTVSTSGQMHFCPQTIRLAAKHLKISEKTVKRHLEILEKRNWIGRFDSGGRIIRSFDKLRKIEKLSGRSAVWFDAKKHLYPFRAFVVSACVAQLIIRQRTNNWRAREEKRESDFLPGSRRGKPIERKKLLPSFYPIACDAMRQIYGIALGTAFNWKKEAHNAGFIEVKKILIPISEGWVHGNQNKAHHILRRGDRLLIQGTDQVRCNLRFTRRKWLCLSQKELDKK